MTRRSVLSNPRQETRPARLLFVGFLQVFTEVIQTSPDCAPRPLSHTDVRGEAEVAPGYRSSKWRIKPNEGFLCGYLRGFWVASPPSASDRPGRQVFPGTHGVSTCGAARRGAPPTIPLLLPLSLVVFPRAAGAESNLQQIAERRTHLVTHTPSFSGLKTHPSPAQVDSGRVVAARRGAERRLPWSGIDAHRLVRRSACCVQDPDRAPTKQRPSSLSAF